MKKYILILAAGVLLAACAEKKPVVTEEKIDFETVVSQRRSTRDFDPSAKISAEQISEIIAVAQNAPSWRNLEPARYHAVLSEEKLPAAKALLMGNAERVSGAAAIVVTTFVKGLSGFRDNGEPVDALGNGWGAYDCGLANSYFVLAARAAGFDTLIMGGRDAEGLRSLLGIPETEEIMTAIAIGVRASEPRFAERPAVEKVVKFY